MNKTLLFFGLLVLSVCCEAQTTFCLLRNDSIVIGTTDRSRIKAVGKFNFISDVPSDSLVTPAIERVASGSRSFQALADSAIPVVKGLLIGQFTKMVQWNPAEFDRQIMRGRTSIDVGHVCLFGVENNRPVIYVIAFYMNRGVRHPVVISHSAGQQESTIFSAGGLRPRNGITTLGHLEREARLWR